MTDRYAVIGNPIAHSKSPEIHAAFARATAQDVEYGRLLAPLDAFGATVAAFRAAGGRGLNVTVPFKGEAYRLATERSDRARAAEAVNTLAFDGARIFGDTTDGVGLVRDIGTNLGVEIAGARVLIAGAGGAARSVLPPLLEARPEAVVVVNRTPERAVELERQFGGRVQAVAFAMLPRQPFDIVINATSAGLAGELPPLEAGVFAARGARLRHDLRRGRRCISHARARSRGDAACRRTRDAGGAGRGVVLHLARSAPRHRAGARVAARREVKLVARVAKGLAYLLGAVVAAFVLVQAWFFAHVLWWDRYNPGATKLHGGAAGSTPRRRTRRRS